MQDNELIRKVLNTLADNNVSTSEEKQTLTEGVHIELDGPEADELVARLLQLSGQSTNLPVPVDAPVADMPASIDMPPAADMDMAPGADIDMPPATDFDVPSDAADHFVSDYSDCEDCGQTMEDCECPVEMSETADHDYGEGAEDAGEVPANTYVWEPSQAPQRMVKGVMGDNPMAGDVMERYAKIVNDYNSFLAEANMPNEDGQASPLTANARDEFKKDPFAGSEAKDDGSMSPMSNIDREDLPK